MLIDEIIAYVQGSSLNKLKNETGVPYNSLLWLFKWHMQRKYRTTVLDILYEFFKLEKDDFYERNKKKWYPSTESLLGTFIRKKRMEKNMSVDLLAKKIKMDSRALKRIEAGDSLPDMHHYSMKHIAEVLELTPSEKKAISECIKALHTIKWMLWVKENKSSNRRDIPEKQKWKIIRLFEI